MREFIASDLHGSLVHAQRLFEAYERERADRILLLGDLLGHSLFSGDNEALLELFSRYGDRILAVRGNCDSTADCAILPFDLPESRSFSEDGRLFFLLHAPDAAPELPEGALLLHGHTHVPAARVGKKLSLFCPGSAAFPRGGSYPGYMTYENGLFCWKSLAGELKNAVKLPE